MSRRPAAPVGVAVAVGTTAVLGVGVLTLVPLGAGAWPVAQVVALRGLLAALAAAAAATLLVALLLVRGARRTLVPLAVACAVVAAAHGAVLAVRSVPTTDAEAAAAGPQGGGGDLVVLTFNTLDAVPASTLADLVTGVGADVVALPETSRTTAGALADRLPPAGWQVLHAPSRVPHVAGTSLVVAAHVGTYPDVEPLDHRLGSLRARPDGDGPVLVAAHPLAPTGRAVMRAWRTEGEAVAAVCRSTPGVVVAGDLNATLDHPALRDTGPCVDAARAAGAGAHGTWPAAAPTLLAAPIDHVLVDERAWRVVDARVLPRVGASDHRPLVAVLARR
ncbi:endonuclease/exonuclease/phosphatase family protein [Cellulomonas sp. JZ18]|uniref:endonuclease/exonuclease/phosphatase family protein n=1 Tax=Cellulomonas sp. JZ18 TaxID=2654191 RepID=UPI0012D39652|nr:endonuclease/exonuclease/phosphatase family protein [Cellulomonas sp. JZ18]QGQ19084.1 endonuclease/exonuclease/phosphatase family protein [Cellulomonas sp. JZ18]